MKTSRHFVPTVLILLVVGGLAGLFFFAFEQVVVTRPVPAKPSAVQNEFLAAVRVLERMGKKADRISVLEAISSRAGVDVLFIKAPRPALSPRAIERVKAFAERGGLLVIESVHHDDEDPLFDAFGLGRKGIDWYEDNAEDDTDAETDEVEQDQDEADEDENEADEVDDEELEEIMNDRRWVAGGERLVNRQFPEPGLHRLQWDADTQLIVHMLGAESLSRLRAEPMLSDQRGTHMLRFPFGQGLVIAVNDLKFVQNFELGRNDQAELLWRLVNLHGQADSVLFFDPDRQDLGAWLRKHAWAPVSVIALLVMLSIWRAMPRFGPIADDPEPVRRRLLDHLRAAGNFLANANQREDLGQAAMRVALARLKREFPHLAIAEPQEFRDFLVKRFALAADSAFLLVTLQSPSSVPDWIRLMRACRDIHAALDHDHLKKSKAQGKSHVS